MEKIFTFSSLIIDTKAHLNKVLKLPEIEQAMERFNENPCHETHKALDRLLYKHDINCWIVEEVLS